MATKKQTATTWAAVALAVVSLVDGRWAACDRAEEHAAVVAAGKSAEDSTVQVVEAIKKAIEAESKRIDVVADRQKAAAQREAATTARFDEAVRVLHRRIGGRLPASVEEAPDVEAAPEEPANQPAAVMAAPPAVEVEREAAPIPKMQRAWKDF